jgi:hypothetical protein
VLSIARLQPVAQTTGFGWSDSGKVPLIDVSSPVVHLFAVNVRRSIGSCPIALAGCAGVWELLKLSDSV